MNMKRMMLVENNDFRERIMERSQNILSINLYIEPLKNQSFNLIYRLIKSHDGLGILSISQKKWYLHLRQGFVQTILKLVRQNECRSCVILVFIGFKLVSFGGSKRLYYYLQGRLYSFFFKKQFLSFCILIISNNQQCWIKSN